MSEYRNDVVVEYVLSDVSFALANATVKSLSYLYAFPKAYDLNSYWRAVEWFPSLVQSAAIVKCLPDSPAVRDPCFGLSVIPLSLLSRTQVGFL